MTLYDPKPKCQGQALVNDEYLRNGTRYTDIITILMGTYILHKSVISNNFE